MTQLLPIRPLVLPTLTRRAGPGKREALRCSGLGVQRVVVLADAPTLLACSLDEAVRCALDRLAGPQRQVVTCERQIRR